MINDVLPPSNRPRRKPKRIEPLAKPSKKPGRELAARAGKTALARPQPDDDPIEPVFQTPEQVAAHNEASAITPLAGSQQKAELKPRWYQFGSPLSRQQRIIGAGILIILAFGVGATWTLTHHRRAIVAETPIKKTIHKKQPAPVIYYSNLSGLPITDASLNQKPVTAVMIENSVDARPQSGLSQAGVVFEAVAEGGVTRFMALYQDTTPTNMGPIRSARPYYVQWAMGFDAAYAHVGGSPDALSDIISWGVKDMNQFYNGAYYHRTGDRPAPHNVYTGIDTLNQLEAKKGYTSTFTGFARKKEQPYKAPAAPSTQTSTTKKGTPVAPADDRTPATSIDFSLSGYTYDPHYSYAAATNSYNRSEAGEAHLDANTNTQLSPKVVIAMVVPESRGALDSSGAYYSDYNPIGSGTAYIFQDGTVTTGQWNKASNSGALTFTDSTGAPLPLNPGQTWISAVTSTSGVKYT
ncbi:MAG TPA: DUF3048 domain-containing protein [Candidatus Saccharimonadales bacterium]|nr:DUF3048 domain-containing protein [Candidatus Saccharimonadales bacterium]